MPVVFSDGFESGDFSEWSAATTDGGDLSVAASAARNGVYGSSWLFDDANLLRLNSGQIPEQIGNPEGVITFDINFGGVSYGDGATAIRHFRFGTSGPGVLRMVVQYNSFPSDTLDLFFYLRFTDGFGGDAGWTISIPSSEMNDDTWHRFTLNYKGFSTTATTGYVTLYHNGVSKGEIGPHKVAQLPNQLFFENSNLTVATSGTLKIDNVAVADDYDDDLTTYFDEAAAGQVGGFWVTLQRN